MAEGFKNMEEAVNAKKQAEKETAEKLEVDWDKYAEFVEVMTSNATKNYDDYTKRLAELKEEGCDVNRLTTAAIGIAAEAGEFQEIVKKVLFQNKPWNQDNKDHLIIELGDIMWYVVQACKALDVRMQDVLIGNTFKLLKRYPEGTFDYLKSEYRAPNDL